MSGSYANTTEAGRYDPDRHDNQIVAVFETRSHAESARDALLKAGLPQSAIQVLDRTSAGATSSTGRLGDQGTGMQDEGFWGAIKSIFAPEEDQYAYHHAIDQGHAMVIVTPTAGTDRHRIFEALEAAGPIDLDEKVEEWRQGGTEYGSRMSGSDRDRLAPTATANTGARATGTGQPAAQGMTGDKDTIQVAKERLRIGKREVAQGAVRVRSYVVERPVEEQVRLHEERVEVERHPVDRPVNPGEAGLFQERTIEARATSEEAVVQKEARVVEEIDIRKVAQDRTETVRDTVRETKVEVDDQGKRQETSGAGAGRSNPPRR